MFVRNNTTCPNCGDCNTFDVTFKPTGDYPDWRMHLECIACSWGLSVDLGSDVLCRIFTAVSKTQPLCELPDSAQRSFINAHRFFSSRKEQVMTEMEFVADWVSGVFKPNTVNRNLTSIDGVFSKVVNYFVESPHRKYKFRSPHFYRTVGL